MVAIPGTFRPFEDAKWFIDELKKAVDKCNAVSMASRSAGAFGNLEAAFYRNETDEDTMQKMKDEVASIIASFDSKCKCQKKV